VKRSPVVPAAVIEPNAATAAKWIVETESVAASQELPALRIPPIHFTITLGVPAGRAVRRTVPVRSASAGLRTVGSVRRVTPKPFKGSEPWT